MPGKFDLKDYVTVAQRLQAFKVEYPNGAINTTLLSAPGDKVVVFRAEAYRNMTDAKPAGTGHAHEIEGQGMVNQTSAMENCETSAVGRALAMMGYEVQNGVASREEMAGAMHRETAAPAAAPRPQAAPQTQTRQQQPAAGNKPTIRNPDEPCTEPQQRRLFALAKQAELDMEQLGVYVKTVYGVTSSKQLTKGQISELMDDIESGRIHERLNDDSIPWATEVADEGAGA